VCRWTQHLTPELRWDTDLVRTEIPVWPAVLTAQLREMKKSGGDSGQSHARYSAPTLCFFQVGGSPSGPGFDSHNHYLKNVHKFLAKPSTQPTPLNILRIKSELLF